MTVVVVVVVVVVVATTGVATPGVARGATFNQPSTGSVTLGREKERERERERESGATPPCPAPLPPPPATLRVFPCSNTAQPSPLLSLNKRKEISKKKY